MIKKVKDRIWFQNYQHHAHSWEPSLCEWKPKFYLGDYISRWVSLSVQKVTWQVYLTSDMFLYKPLFGTLTWFFNTFAFCDWNWSKNVSHWAPPPWQTKFAICLNGVTISQFKASLNHGVVFPFHDMKNKIKCKHENIKISK